MAVARLNDDNLTKIVYLRVKTFIPVDPNISCWIKDFTNGQVNTMSVKLIDNMGFDNMPMISLNGIILGLITKTVRNTPQHQNDDMEFYQMLEEIRLAEDPDNLRILLSRCLLNTIWASEALRVLWGSPLKINNKNVKGFLTALFKFLPPERKSHIMHHGFNVTLVKAAMEGSNLVYLKCCRLSLDSTLTANYCDLSTAILKKQTQIRIQRCKIEDFEDLAMKISYLYISMPKDVIDYLNGVMKRYSKNSSEFQYIKKGLKCRERCNLLELAKRDSCL
ncbi:17412_t:CDS:2 [Rhizophagus irregularis]|nr:17412_t:CDS:2 [Rhizophagus irregularis]